MARKNLFTGALTASLVLLVLFLFSTGPTCRAAAPTFSDVPTNHWASATVEYGAQNGYILGTGNGMFSPNKELTFNETITLLDRICYKGEAAPATDSSSWYLPHKQNLESKYILLGLTDKGNHGVRRYEVAQMIYNIMVDLGADRGLSDWTRTTDWNDIPEQYQAAVSWCLSHGLFKGNANGTFGCDYNLTRAEGATIVYRLDQAVAELQDGQTEQGEQDQKEEVTQPSEDTTTDNTPDVSDTTETSDTTKTSDTTDTTTQDLGEEPELYGSIGFVDENGEITTNWSCTKAEFDSVKARCEAAGLTLKPFNELAVSMGLSNDYLVSANGDSAKAAAISALLAEGYENSYWKYQETKTAKETAEKEAAWDGNFDCVFRPTYTGMENITKRMTQEEVVALVEQIGADGQKLLQDYGFDFTYEVGDNWFEEVNDTDYLYTLIAINRALSLYPENVMKTLADYVTISASGTKFNACGQTMVTRCKSDKTAEIILPPENAGTLGIVHEFGHALFNYVEGSTRSASAQKVFEEESENALANGLREYGGTNCAEFIACMIEKYIYYGEVDFCETYAPKTTALIEDCLKKCGATQADLNAIRNHDNPVYAGPSVRSTAYDSNGNCLGEVEDNRTIDDLRNEVHSQDK